ncbi:cytochrome P450 [Polyplosphaeria fusca]|uniref:Cytochrome P450 n=1 Tax=Polyplosphaeria fusca TaxID=682080 RepID=A0A9P4QM36_9PLEO|nr:cytochrome P450 [Polyplosphaeria fusca]
MQSLYLLHTSPTVFPDPLSFRPERWIADPSLTKYMFAFSRGSRMCLGINLAMSELYFGVAYAVRCLEMRVVETVEERDVLTTNDCFVGMTDLGSEGVKVEIVGEVED